MTPEKFGNALAFLTLDSVSPFRESLWIGDALDSWRSNGLKRLIADSLYTEKYHERYAELCFQAYDSLIGSRKEVWRELWSWTNVIYLHGGVDRQPERIWSSLLIQHNRSEINSGEGWNTRLFKIEEKITASMQHLAPLLEKLPISPQSEWDSMVMPQIHTDPSFVADKLVLLLRWNELIKAWKSEGDFQIEELCEIYEWGKKRAVNLGLRDVDLPFPGSWEYGLAGWQIWPVAFY